MILNKLKISWQWANYQAYTHQWNVAKIGGKYYSFDFQSGVSSKSKNLMPTLKAKKLSKVSGKKLYGG
jgi:hypothetical protein